MLHLLTKISLVSCALGQDFFLTRTQLEAEIPRSTTPRPHILFLLIDDLGHAQVGWNRVEPTKEVATPSMDVLAHEGIILDRHYVHKFCSPTRSAIQSGRAPIHVNVINADPSVNNAKDPVSGFAGIPRNMTGIAEVLKSAGYSTHMAGKWDVGMATPDHTPAGRGYDTSLSYFHHANDCWKFTTDSCQTSAGKVDIRDMWNYKGNISFPGRPAKAKKNDEKCSFENQHPGGTCVYEDQLFEERVTNTIINHNPSKPLFIFWATRTVHGALQPPDEEIAKFAFIDNKNRKLYHSMVSWIDGAVGRVVVALKNKGMYDNTLIVMCSDNGGPLPAGNNYPLKGGKFANWEGGIRVAAFVSGGFVPQAVRGTVQTNLVTGWDWYATFAALAGADPTDKKAARAGLPPHDSINQWPMLSGANSTAPRTRVEIGSNARGEQGRRDGVTMVGGIIIPPYKIVIGYGPNDGIDMAGWPGPQSPNSTTPADFKDMVESCGRTPETGCLYDVFADPGEHHNLARDKPDVFKKLLLEVEAVNRTVFSPNRGEEQDAACNRALHQYGGYWGPFLP